MKQRMENMLTKLNGSKEVTRQQKEQYDEENLPRSEAADGIEGDEDMIDNQPGTIVTTSSS